MDRERWIGEGVACLREMVEEKYRAFLEQIELLGRRQDQAYSSQIRCRVGCFACCRPPDSLFQVEAARLEGAVRALPSDIQDAIRERLQAYLAGERELCPLLDRGACQVYADRPVICRTHGYSLMMRDDDGAFLSWCELNFEQEAPSGKLAFDVEHLNTVLSMLTQLGWPAAEARRSLEDILSRALSDDEAGDPKQGRVEAVQGGDVQGSLLEEDDLEEGETSRGVGQTGECQDA